ncbi:hypothetical protein ITO93_004483, partial [Salmonella enterica subsp. enterica serovar Mbandaka]|nr:hypothetical protein [Salmonella enterica subsp. enterica serovar Mbandaka]EGO1915941.1 hypothetical protein [Salmonella enterica subsp. enterica serovar Mbandaka]
MENIKSWIVLFLIFVLLNVGLSLWWDSQNKFLALYNVTVMTLDIMLTPLAVVLAF